MNFATTILDKVATMEAGEKRSEILTMISNTTGVSREELESQLKKRRENAAKRQAQAAARSEREKRNALIQELTASVEAFRVNNNIDGSFAALEGFREQVEELGGIIVLSGIDGDSPVFTVRNLAAKTTRKGGGKPGKDTPRPFVDSDGNRIVGPLTSWAQNNLTEEQLVDAPRRENGSLQGGRKLTKFLLDAGFIVDSPLED